MKMVTNIKPICPEFLGYLIMSHDLFSFFFCLAIFNLKKIGDKLNMISLFLFNKNPIKLFFFNYLEIFFIIHQEFFSYYIVHYLLHGANKYMVEASII